MPYPPRWRIRPLASPAKGLDSGNAHGRLDLPARLLGMRRRAFTMLLQCRGQEIRIAPATPETWRAYAFRLACHGNLVAEVRVQDRRLRRLTLEPGNGQTEHRRTLVIPSQLLDEGTLDRKVLQSVEPRGANKQIAIRFKGRVEIVR